MKLRLHHCHQTRSMRVLWLLHELDVPFDVQVHSFGKNLRDPSFLVQSPAGRVPALEMDGKAIFESGAMMELLCETFPEAGLGRAPGDDERADWLVWLHFAETISQHSAALTQQHVALYEDHMRSPVVMKLEAARLGKCFAALEGRLSSRAHILDRGFSAADIAVGQAIYMARHFRDIAPYRALSDWYDRITARPAFVASLPPKGATGLYERPFYEVPHG